jgi:hypothetical protein
MSSTVTRRATKTTRQTFQKVARMNAEAAARAFSAALDADLAIFEALGSPSQLSKLDQQTCDLLEYTNTVHDQAEANLIEAIHWSGPVEVDGYRYSIAFRDIQECFNIYANSL